MPLLFPALVVASTALWRPGEPGADERARWRTHAAAVTITRDDHGIPHISGRTDADAVFGLLYAQAEDDFNRIEVNFLTALGRLAEAEGEQELPRDLRARLLNDPDSLRAAFARSPRWLRRVMEAWADGINFYLATHPETHPRVLARFEPWMALAFTEGSIGGDLETIRLAPLAAFYAKGGPAALALQARMPEAAPAFEERGGSNGIAIAPANTTAGHALLLINPHTSFFFRAEVQVQSDEGLNVYGAVTWGQCFVYQGFNARTGWIHTTSGVDAVDEYLETVEKRNGGWVYHYAGGVRPVHARTVTLRYRSGDSLATWRTTLLGTHHGPVVRAQDGKWVTVRMLREPVKALTQSFRRTKARSYAEFRRTMELHTNSSNNTVFASADGDIAYFHANFIPRRDPRFDWTKPVDGSDPATEWRGVLDVDASPNVHNPATGWIQNTNNWPFSVAGEASPRQADFPAYVEKGGENARGIHAMQVLRGRRDFTLDRLVAAAFDPDQPAFAPLLPRLVAAYDSLPASHPTRAALAEPVAALRAWDRHWGATSVETTLAVYWGEALAALGAAEPARGSGPIEEWMERRATADQRLRALEQALARLTADFGTWRTPWGEVNRFQRRTGAIVQQFADSAPSIAVPFTTGQWGSLASFAARTYPGTRRRYGTSGNSFVAVVEFGDRVRARAVTAGGESGNPASPHFNDQAVRYANGDLGDVYFHPDELAGHVERRYHPGE